VSWRVALRRLCASRVRNTLAHINIKIEHPDRQTARVALIA